ncbi:MAG: glycosyl hydrolase family 28 protein [Chthoniobacteraceae bacterium]|nr:glycosyl hydrolase family 28 protein [Chthoniobacteraceae bacterium]
MDSALAKEAAQTSLYNQPPQPLPYFRESGAPISINYTCRLNGEPAYVHNFSGFAGGDISWVSFDFRESATVSVTALRNVDKAEVRPASAAIAVKLEDNTATLTVTGPCRLFLKWEDGFELPFHIFANRIEEGAPKHAAPGVHYFGPGTHRPGVIRLSSGETLYIADGAIVYGVIEAENAKHVAVRGRGILCTSHLDRKSKETYEVNGVPREVVSFRNCTDIEVEGITILDAHHWTVVFRNCERVHVSNIKMFNERSFSTDGINPVNCRDVLIENCFVRCKDDCVSIKGLDNRYPGNAAPIRNIVVQNCVFWSDNNNGIVVGSETKAQTISDILFRNIDLLRVSNTCGDYAGALSVICLHDTDISGIRFEDIRIEHCHGPYFNFFFCDSLFRIPGARQPKGGTFRDITLKNVSVVGGPDRRSYIMGFDEKRMIENVRIENLRIHGRLIHNADEGRIQINEFTRNIRFLCGAAPEPPDGQSVPPSRQGAQRSSSAAEKQTSP